MRQAFIAAEDSSFYSHPGIDFVGILRAAVANFLAGEIKQGASTITQQVARSFFLTPERQITTASRRLRKRLRCFISEA